jgi:hypothetical protein
MTQSKSSKKKTRPQLGSPHFNSLADAVSPNGRVGKQGAAPLRTNLGSTYRCDSSRLLELALQRGYGNAVKLARAADIDRITAGKALKGQPVLFATIKCLASVLGCQPADLLVHEEMAELRVPRRLGISKVYAGESDNKDRNTEKQGAILRTNGDVLLLARTAYSYLCDARGVHCRTVRQFLHMDEANRFIAVILNPYSMAAIEVYLMWLHSCRPGGCPGDYVAQQIGKLTNSLEGFRSLKREFAERVQLQLTSFDVSMTILTTSDAIFVEPYFQADEEKRIEQGLVGFEIEFNRDASLGPLIASTNSDDKHLAHLDFFLRHSISYQAWKSKLALMASQYDSQLEFLLQTSQILQCEAEELGRVLRSLSTASR